MQDNPVTLSQYLRLASLAKEDNPSYRMGQAYYNVLDNVRPDLASRIVGTHIDPFHRDCVIAQFLAWVASNW